MFGKKQKGEEHKAAPAANENGLAGAAGAKPAKPGFKDKPRPFSVFREEAARTKAAREDSMALRGAADRKLTGLQEGFAPALEAFDKELTAADEARLKIRRETVESLTAEVGASRELIAELEKKLREERAKLARSEQDLKTASRALKTEDKKTASEHKTAYKGKKKELSGEISAARKERKAIYGETGRRLRRERWHTLSSTTKETLAVVPDLTMRFAKAAKRGVCEVLTVFGRSARSARKGFDEPTLFSIRREQPVNPPKKEKKPKAQAPGQ